jgi:hypothetical protein
MNKKRSSLLMGLIAIAILQFAVISSQSQIIKTNGATVIINNFDTSDQVYFNDNLTDGGVPGNGTLWPWGNWFGQAFSNVVWDANDSGQIGDTPGSGSMLIQSYFPDGGVGGMYGTQFVLYNGFASWTGGALTSAPFNPPFQGYGSLVTNVNIVTNFTCDIRFAAFSATNADGTFPAVEFGTAGADMNANPGQYPFGSVILPVGDTNWFHVSIPIAANTIWSNIPNVYIKIFSGLTTNATTPVVPEFLYVDNLKFQQGIPPVIPPPTNSIHKATSALRIFAQGPQYQRTQIATVDTNQSWVGGTYPVSYSCIISGYDPKVAVNEFHWFWLTPAFNSGTLNQFSDYSTDLNTLRLNITQASPGTGSNGTVVAEVRWKVNQLNSNGTNIVLVVTNPTIIGTWTVTFNSATTGTLTPPGGSASPFTINDANIATDFGNPVVWEFGMQPDGTNGNSSANNGAYVDITHAQTVNVATGVPVNSDFTTGSINTNVWLTSSVSVANGAGLVPVSSANTPWWISWNTPDLGFGLATKADIGNHAIAWKTPNYYANYPSNGPSALNFGGVYKWELIPTNALPSVDGTSNGVKAANAFWLLQSPVPAQ